MISPNGFASADVARKAEADAKDAVALCDRQRLTCRIVCNGATLYTNR